MTDSAPSPLEKHPVPDDPGDLILLKLPAAPEFVGLARLTSAGLATRLGMSYDEVEDLRIAVGEACSLLIGAGERSGTLVMRCLLGSHGLSIEIVAELDGPTPERPGDVELSDDILDAVVDEHVVALADDRVWLLKRPASGEVGAGRGTGANGV